MKNTYIDTVKTSLKGTIFTDSPGLKKTAPRPVMRMESKTVESKGGHFTVAKFKIVKKTSDRGLNKAELDHFYNTYC